MGVFWQKWGRAQIFITVKLLCYLKNYCFLKVDNFSGSYHLFVILKNGVFCEMVILVVFKNF